MEDTQNRSLFENEGLLTSVVRLLKFSKFVRVQDTDIPGRNAGLLLGLSSAGYFLSLSLPCVSLKEICQWDLGA